MSDLASSPPPSAGVQPFKDVRFDLPGAHRSTRGRPILLLSYEFPPLGGGGAKVVAGLGSALVELGYEVDLVTMGFRGLPSRDVVGGVRVHRAPCVRTSEAQCHPPEMLTYLATALSLTLRLARSRNYLLNHTHFVFPDGVLAYALFKLAGLPYIITTHGSDVPGYNPDRFQLYHRLLAPAWHQVTRGAHRIVCPSETLASLVRRRNSRLPITVIPNGFNPDCLHPDREKGDRILVVTRMVRRKGVQYLLDALADLQLPNEVSIVGDGPYLNDLREQARRLNLDVTFHGWMENGSAELHALYETSRIFALPSEAENFPISLLEAMAAGCAIITTEGTGCAEVVGEAGVLIPAKSGTALACALRELVRDPERCASLGAAARQRLQERFSWEVVARRYSALYERVVTSSR